MLDPAFASFTVYSPKTFPSTPTSICFIPVSPFKSPSKVFSIPVLPIISSFLYPLFFFSSYSFLLILDVYPIICAASLPLKYVLI